MAATSDVPRYLFRAYSPGSDGLNDATGFSAQARRWNSNNIRSLSQLPRQYARSMLQDHVLWHSWEKRFDDILISFTPSFLFALQHSVRKIYRSRRTTEENCYICIIDTSKYPPGTFSWTVDLLKEYDLDETKHPLLQHRFHEAEYLAQSEVTIVTDSSKRVSFSTLVLQGRLYEAIPELGEEAHRHRLWRRLQELRATWYQGVRPVTHQEFEQAHRLALCFGGHWVPVMMMWALATKARLRGDVLVKTEFNDDFYGEIMKPYLFTDPETQIPQTVRELVEWQKLMRTAYNAQQETATGQVVADEEDELLIALERLGL